MVVKYILRAQFHCSFHCNCVYKLKKHQGDYLIRELGRMFAGRCHPHGAEVTGVKTVETENCTRISE